MNSPAHALLWTGLNGRDADAADPGFRPGGVILFSRNLDPDPAEGPARCHALLADRVHLCKFFLRCCNSLII